MTVPSYWLVIPAAGRGARFGGPTPKQYLALGTRTVLEHSLAPFLADRRLLGVAVALSAHDTHFDTLPVASDPRIWRVVGGQERADSVQAGLAHVRAVSPAGSDPWVLVHDAVRPLISPVEIHLLLDSLGDSPDGALLAAPVADTLKRADASGAVDHTVDRSGLWRALTPQAFTLSLLERALAHARAEGRAVTDDAQAVEALGRHPRLVPGSAANLKVTQPGDLALAELVLRERAEVVARASDGRTGQATT